MNLALAWRRVFRTAAVHAMSRTDVASLKEDIRPRAVIDLRTPRALNVPFRPQSPDYAKRETELFRDGSDMGALYLYRIRHPDSGKRLVDSLELIADRNKHPLKFHCSLGKDRTGVLAAMLLETAGVIDEDIVHDYTLSAFQWEASAESMARFLELLRRDYGSAAGYLEAQGADSSLPRRLQEALLVP